MSKVKLILLPLIFILVSIALLFVGFSELNIISGFDLGELLSVNTKPTENVLSNAQLIEELKLSYCSSDNESFLPDDMNALWIDINKDITASAEEGTEAVKYSIYSDFDYYRNFVPDTVFVKPDTENEFSELLEPDGSHYDVLAYLLYYVRSIGCEAILVADDSILLDSDNKPYTDLIEKYLTDYDFKGVLISVDSAYSTPLYTECAQTVRSFIDNKFDGISVGIEIHSDFEKMFADDYVTSVFQNKMVDFGYLDILCTSGDSEFPFQGVALWWNYFAEYYDVPFYCEHRLDKVFSEDGDWSYSNEINNQLKALYSCSAFDGSCYYNASVLKNKKALARDLAIFLNDVSGTNQDAFEVDSLSLNGNNVSFTGKTAQNINIFCNDKRVFVTDGIFDYNADLAYGNNDFKFFGNGGYYTYSIYNNLSLIYSCSTNDSIRLNSDMIITPYAVCPEGAVVFAVVNGSYFQLNVAADAYNYDVPEGFTCYSSDISFFGKDIVSDELDIICFYDDTYDNKSCGSILGSTQADASSVVEKNGNMLTPFFDNGLGTSLMCYTKYDNTEIISDVDDYDTYHPYNSSLPAGTYDYVTNINVSDGGYIRYELKSGLNVYGVDAVLINNAYNMPLNKVVLKNTDFSADSSVFTFVTDWNAPVTVTVKDAVYSVGYEGFSFNVTEFNAKYVDINFYYSDVLQIASQFTLDNDYLFSSYEIISDTANSLTTLRLYLKSAGEFYGYDILINENGETVVTFNNIIRSSVSGKTIMLDPGHGGISMVGTALNDNSMSESQITLSVALYAKKYLESMGATVIMTRIMDTSLSLSERTYMCETENPDIFVSIHCDGSADLTESGTHTFYYTPFSFELASDIHKRVVAAYTNEIYTEADENYENTDRNVKYYPFYVTRVDNCPSVLIETGFLTNYVEGNVLANPVNQEIIGKAIAYGIVDYFS